MGGDVPASTRRLGPAGERLHVSARATATRRRGHGFHSCGYVRRAQTAFLRIDHSYPRGQPVGAPLGAALRLQSVRHPRPLPPRLAATARASLVSSRCRASRPGPFSAGDAERAAAHRRTQGKHSPDMSKRLWLTWERQRRNRTTSAALGARLFEFRPNGSAPVRYGRSLLRTWWTLRSQKPTLVFAQNPSLVLANLATVYGRRYRTPVVVDAHNGALEAAQRPTVRGLLA